MYFDNDDFLKFLSNVLLVDKDLEVWIFDIPDECFYKVENGDFVKTDITYAQTVNFLPLKEREDYKSMISDLKLGELSFCTKDYHISRDSDVVKTYRLNFMRCGNVEGNVSRYILCSLKDITSETEGLRKIDLYSRKEELLNEYFEFMELGYFPQSKTYNFYGGRYNITVKKRPVEYAYTLVKDEDVDRLKKLVARADMLVDEELELRLKIRFIGHSHYTHVIIALVPVYDTNGAVVSYSGKVADVTQEEEEHEKVMRLIKKIKILNKKYKISLWQFDLETGLFEPEEEDVENANIRTYTIGEVLERTNPTFRQASSECFSAMLEGTYEPNQFVTYFKTKDNTYKLIQVVPEKILDEKGKVKKYIFILRDITEERRKMFQLNKYAHHTHLINKYCGITLWSYKPGSHLLVSEDPFIQDSRKKFDVDDVIEMTHPDDREKTRQVFRNVDGYLVDEVSFTTREKYMNTNDYHVYRVEGVPMRNEYDEIIEYGIMKSDITENVNLIKDNEESHHLLTSILESLPAMVFIKDIDNEFRFVIANASFVTFFTGENKNIVGLKESEFATPEMEQVCRKSDLEAIQYTIENPLTQIETFPHADGTFSYLQSIKFASKIHGRNLLICAALDVTELQTAKSKAENSDRLKSAFLANISHEIRTPLNAIVGFSDLLMTTDDPAEKEQFCQIIHTNNEKLLMLISDIIDLSKIDSGSMSFVKDNFDVNDLMGDVLRLYEQKMDQTSIDFQVIKNNVPFVINQDKDHILEVLRNFINNAIKYTSEGFIKVWYEQENNGVKFYVKDTGIGISPENYEKVFQRFEKIDSFVQGTGLGLSICKSIAHKLSGEVGLDSQLGKGSTFWLWVPIA